MTTAGRHVEQLRVARDWRTVVVDGGVLRAWAATGRVLHDTARSRVLEVATPLGPVVVKRARRLETSRWIQVTSLWRDGEGVRAYDLLERLAADGLPVPAPVAALDVRRGGLVRESFVAYRFLDGQPCTCEDAPAIARLLARVHALGWVHGDPHVRNFLHVKGEVVWLDCVSARRRRSPFARAFDLALLEKCCPSWRSEARADSPAVAWLRLARLGSRAMVAWRALKRRARASARRLVGIRRQAE